MNTFHIDTATLHEVFAEALRRGGDYADLFCEHTLYNNLSMQDGNVNKANSTILYGAGLRVTCGDQNGYAYVEEINRQQLLKAAHAAAEIANGKCHVNLPPNLTELHAPKSYYPIGQSWTDCEIDRLVAYIKDIDETLKAREGRILTTRAILAYKTQHIAFANSLGQTYHDCLPLASLTLTCVAKDGDVIEQAGASRSFRMGAEMLSDALKEELVNECIQKLRFAIEATQPKGGVMPVVMAAGASGILLHEAIGHAFEADHCRKDESIFANALGKRICLPSINIVDDGTLPNNRGSINFDDEGTPSQKTYIVRDGKLCSFLHDRISARHYGVTPTGNGRRTSFRYMPIPRMRATYMEAGNVTEDDLIRSVDRGIYVNSFTNGQVQIGMGDFTFFVKSGYLIENGRLTAPIKDINIIGNGPQALTDIQAVGNNPRIDNGTWMCGKAGQSCPVSCGMPSVLVGKLTVGGK